MWCLPVRFPSGIQNATTKQNLYKLLWDEVKKIVSEYFNDKMYYDGAYTIFQEHLISKHD